MDGGWWTVFFFSFLFRFLRLVRADRLWHISVTLCHHTTFYHAVKISTTLAVILHSIMQWTQLWYCTLMYSGHIFTNTVDGSTNNFQYKGFTFDEFCLIFPENLLFPFIFQCIPFPMVSYILIRKSVYIIKFPDWKLFVSHYIFPLPSVSSALSSVSSSSSWTGAGQRQGDSLLL